MSEKCHEETRAPQRFTAPLISSSSAGPRFCRHHAARSVAIDEPVPFVRPKMIGTAVRLRRLVSASRNNAHG
jgi:hypothetical protein